MFKNAVLFIVMLFLGLASPVYAASNPPASGGTVTSDPSLQQYIIMQQQLNMMQQRELQLQIQSQQQQIQQIQALQEQAAKDAKQKKLEEIKKNCANANLNNATFEQRSACQNVEFNATFGQPLNENIINNPPNLP